MSFSDIFHIDVNEFDRSVFLGIIRFEWNLTFSIPSSSKRFTTISVISVISIVPKKKYVSMWSKGALARKLQKKYSKKYSKKCLKIKLLKKDSTWKVL